MMSRVYRALEKAEEEKKKMEREKSPLSVFEKKMTLREKEPFFEKRVEREKGLELPQDEETSSGVISLNPFAREEFRKLKTQVFHRLPHPPHTLLITSAAPGEGKTTVAIHLANAISLEINKKAVLIDADLRKPGVHFDGFQNTKGLSDYLNDTVPLSNILMESGTENLQVIHSGPSTERSTELIGSKKMEELLTALKRTGDSTYILIDSSPIISTSEPALLSRMVDGIILVILADQTPKEHVQRALKLIDRQKLIGVVFNQVDVEPSSHYAKYYYHYYRK